MDYHAKRGFSLIELLVSVSILILLTSLIATYSRRGNQIIALSQEQMRLIGTINRGKSSALQTYIEPGWPPVCGYGVHFDSAEYFIYRIAAKDCSAAGTGKRFPVAIEIDASDIQIKKFGETFQLPPGLNFTASPPLTDIYFEPPDPTITFLDSSSELADQQAQITLSTSGVSPASITITVNKMGQISSQ